MEKKNHNSSGQLGKLSRRRHIVRSFAAKLNQQRTLGERIADFFTSTFGSLPFAVFHIVWFIAWIGWNMGWVSGLKPFDPFPFGLLTMVVSLEAIFLAIFVLVSQNREAKVDRLRSEVNFQVDLTTEQETTKILSILRTLAEKNGIDLSEDEDLEGMMEPIDEWKVEKKLEKQLEPKKK